MNGAREVGLYRSRFEPDFPEKVEEIRKQYGSLEKFLEALGAEITPKGPQNNITSVMLDPHGVECARRRRIPITTESF